MKEKTINHVLNDSLYYEYVFIAMTRRTKPDVSYEKEKMTY